MKRLSSLLCLLLLAGCVTLKQAPWQEAGPELLNAASTALEQDWLGQSGVAMLRLQGRLKLGSRRVELAAVMRRDADKHVARLVLMGEMGMTLCDMDVTPSGHITHQAVPDLEKRPRILQHIARTVRRVFLLPVPPAGALEEHDRDFELLQRKHRLLLRYRTREQLLERIYDKQTRDLLVLQSPKEDWEARYSGYETEAGKSSINSLPFPGRIEYRDTSGGYSVQMLLLSMNPPQEKR